MRLLVLLSAIPLLVSDVQAGSRLWETSATVANPGSGVIMERAVPIMANDDPKDNAGVRRWPEKTLTFAFNDAEAEGKLSRLFEAGKRLWSHLDEKGFQYNKINVKKCKARRSDCLIVHYNDRGIFTTTVGLQPVEDGHIGPTMHLSDVVEAGNLDPAVNTAHEIGHSWGLWHEHQLRVRWGSDADDPGELLDGNTWKFKDYHPENLKDWEDVLERMAKKMGLESSAALTKEDKDMLRISQDTAEEYDFSGLEWMPARMRSIEPDAEVDEDSLMLYPSGAGAKGEVILKDDGTWEDRRLPVLTYPGGKRMPLKKRPSGRDIEALVKLYSKEYRGVSRLHNDKSSKFKGLLKKVRSTLSLRAGDTEEGMC